MASAGPGLRILQPHGTKEARAPTQRGSGSGVFKSSHKGKGGVAHGAAVLMRQAAAEATTTA